MKKYLIEREIPGSGNLTAGQLKEISQNSNSVLDSLGTEIQWLHSYVTNDKIFCVYLSKNENLINEHAKLCSIPANSIMEIITIIDPTTAE
jgi:hypothetical protein